MQEFKSFEITPEEIVPLAEKKRKAGVMMVMMHGYVQTDGQPRISWEYECEKGVESYYVVGQTKLPSIVDIYDTAAEWPEREINELMGIEFEGLDVSKRLFLPEDMLETQGKGQIIVTPLSELVEKRHELEEQK